jgi:hypothetical protein
MKSFVAWAFGIEKDDGEVVALLAKGAIVLDARSPAKYAAGHAYNAINVPTGLLSAAAAYAAVRVTTPNRPRVTFRSIKYLRNANAGGVGFIALLASADDARTERHLCVFLSRYRCNITLLRPPLRRAIVYGIALLLMIQRLGGGG